MKCLEYPDQAIDGKIFNAGYENHKVKEIAEMVQNVVGEQVEIVTTPTNDNRSYHVSSDKIRQELGFVPQHSIEEASADLVKAFKAGLIPNSMTDTKYFNIKTMQAIELK